MRRLFLLLPFLLSACSSTPPVACTEADWRLAGFRVGSDGKLVPEFPESLSSCERTGLPNEREAFLEGAKEGTSLYCAPEMAYVLGYQGREYTGVCSRAAEPGFRSSYEDGRKSRRETLTRSYRASSQK